MIKTSMIFVTLLGWCHTMLANTLTWRESHFAQGGYAIGQVSEGTTIQFLGHDVKPTPQGHFIIGFGRDLKPEQSIRLIDRSGMAQTIQLHIKQRDYDIERIDGLPPQKVNPRTEAQLNRIRQETQLVVSARRARLHREDFLSDFTWPLYGRISGVYGSQRVLNGHPKRPHFGIDIAAKTGTAVSSPNGGQVTLVHHDMYYSGGTLIVDHGYGLSSTFIHLSKIYVKEGDRIKAGDIIAAVGATGRATGPHLDWRINWYNQRLDPVYFTGPMPRLNGNASPKGIKD